VRVRRRYFIGEHEWYTEWKKLRKDEATRVNWQTRTIEIDPWLKKKSEGFQEYALRHELLHIILGNRDTHTVEKIAHWRIVELGMRLDNLIHLGRDTFKGRE
jgi:hypothetical protein